MVSVLIPTRQRREAIHRALVSLARQTVPAEEYEVIVVVDGSTDGTLEMLAGLSPPHPLHVVEGASRGRAAACNAGLKCAHGDVTIVLDDDMEVVPGFIGRHRAHHERGSTFCVMGAVPVLLDKRSPLAARHVATRFEAHQHRLSQTDHIFVPRDFYSGNTSVRTEVLVAVGGFDESFATYGNEDVELGVRLRAAGVEFRFDPDALAYQSYTKTLRDLARDTRAKGGTTVLLARAHPEIFPALRLAQPDDASRPWLAIRALLLALTRRWSHAADAVFAGASLAERIGLWRQPLFYRALLDYAFWTGADDELHRRPDAGSLATLAAELHRGPIDLLLHA